MAEPLSLYSTITRIAYTIGQRFYGEKHYVWCTPAKGVDTIVGVNPPSADPVHIYFSLLRDVKSNEGHTSKIAENRRGLIHGANVKEGEGLIDTRTRELIEKIINRATITDFRPLFLVMPFTLVKGLVRSPDIADVASALSQEYIIDALPRDKFDILDLDGLNG